MLRWSPVAVISLLFLLPSQVMACGSVCEEDVKVISVSQPPGLADSILGFTYVKIIGIPADSFAQDFYLLYVKKFTLPKVGALCKIRYEFSQVKGLVGGTSGTTVVDDARSILSMECSDGTIIK